MTARSTNLSVGLARRLREDILSEKLTPGCKLTEQQLSNAYKVSRTPVREALKNLETEGLIKLIPNRGAFVTGFSRKDMQDLLILRKAYELQAVKWAIERITEDELENLEKCFEFMKFYTIQKDLEKLCDINRHFHNIIYDATENRTLINILHTFNNYIRHSALTRAVEIENLDSIFAEHTNIFDAFIKHDPCVGEKAMATHLDNATERYML